MTPEKKRGNPAAEMELQKELEDKVIGRMIDIYQSSLVFGKFFPDVKQFERNVLESFDNSKTGQLPIVFTPAIEEYIRQEKGGLLFLNDYFRRQKEQLMTRIPETEEV